MSEEVTTATGAQEVAPADKWVPGLTTKQSVGEVAGRVLEARLKAVWHWLPLAAEHSEQDVEYVHQLRISTRRAQQAVRVFAGVLPEGTADDLGVLLRRLRQAADDARNWDVLRNQFLRCDGDSGTGIVLGLIERIQAQRRAAQPRLVSIHQELAASGLPERFDRLVAELPGSPSRKSRRKFGRRAKRFLKPAVRRFFAAATRELASDKAIHDLRLRAKELRYTMEIVAVAFEPPFRERLYPHISRLQDLIGAVHDHAVARDCFRAWLAQTPELEQRGFLEGMLLAEARAYHDLLDAFRAWWSSQAIAKLRRQFRLYCGVD